MANFYNPYAKGGFDLGQGMDGLINQIVQMLMIKKMGGGGQDKPQQGAPIPMNPNLGGASMGQVNQGLGQMPGMGNTPESTFQGQDNDLISKILALFSRNQKFR